MESKYSVKLMSRAKRDLNGIYNYIARTLLEPETALTLAERLEEAILSLDHMPLRCPERKTGVYANRGYRQLFIENYTVVFRVYVKAVCESRLLFISGMKI